jgi:predicted branched-subunit amino acid permease
MAPLAIGDVVDGMVFGALAVAAGLGQIAPVLLSLTAFSGSAQYAAVLVMRQHGAPAAALLAAAALNIRYLALGATVAGALPGSRWRKAAACLLLTDASWALVASRPRRDLTARLLAGAGFTELLAWTGGTAAGVLAGAALGDTSQYGLDAAFPALFLWLLRHQLNDRRSVVAALVGGALVAALIPSAPAGVPVLAAGLAAAVWGAWR